MPDKHIPGRGITAKKPLIAVGAAVKLSLLHGHRGTSAWPTQRTIDWVRPFPAHGRPSRLLAKINVLSAPALPLHRHDSASPRSAPATPNAPFEIENLGVGAEPEPQQKVRRQQRHMVADSAIDLHEVAMPEFLDPRHV